jgi:hypothetical protein
LFAGVERMDFDKYLGVYNREKYREWQSLVFLIRRELLDKLEPIGKTISSVFDASGEEPQLPPTPNASSHRPYFTDIPKNPSTKGLSPHEITKRNLDKSELLDKILKTFPSHHQQHHFLPFFLSIVLVLTL